MATRSNGVVMGHPTLNSNVRQVAFALASADLLEEFHTTIDTTVLDRSIGRVLPTQLRGRRSLPPGVHDLTTQHPLLEARRRASILWARATRERIYPPDTLAHGIDSIVAGRLRRVRPPMVYAYEDSAHRSFVAAKEFGARTFYDLPIGHWKAAQTIFDDEALMSPDWVASMPGRGLPKQDTRHARKDGELGLADHIAVASSFTAQTLRDVGHTKVPVSIIPYGAPPVYRGDYPGRGRKLRALFVGGLTQRKGLSYLFDAVAPFGNHVELTVVGRRMGVCPAVDVALSDHTWIPSAPHSAILELMRSHDILIFPSLFEGFGLVLTEALSQGLPVIATPHTAAPDLISDGVEGWVVPIRSSESIALRINALLADPGQLDDMRQAAKKRASELSWSSYRARVIDLVNGQAVE